MNALALAFHIASAEVWFLTSVAKGSYEWTGGGMPESIKSPADVVAWYDQVSRVLSAALADAFAANDAVRIAELKHLLDARSATEMRIVGALDLVGRG